MDMMLLVICIHQPGTVREILGSTREPGTVSMLEEAGYSSTSAQKTRQGSCFRFSTKCLVPRGL